MQIRLMVPSELVRLRDLTAAIDAVLETNAVCREVRDDVRLIAEEIVANAIEHGGSGAETEIVVQIMALERKLAIEFRDCGRPFDPLAVEAPMLDAPLEERVVGGLGLHLVHELAESLSYTREDPYNVLRVTVRSDTQPVA
jgi:sigma-B regulation protein RsbU (phosphoserine phosphatase)